MADPFGRAIRDYHLDRMTGPLERYDGDDVESPHSIEHYYFAAYTAADARSEGLGGHLQGPLLDVGCGVGRHALYFQDRFETVGLEVSEHLVATACDRGVDDVRRGDMFTLREQFPRDRFRSVLCVGTQLGLAGSRRGITDLLDDFAFVTTPDATAVVDTYDPTHPDCPDLLGYRADPTPGLAYRVFHFEYDGAVGRELLFRLLSPARLREAIVGSGWQFVEIRRGEPGPHYRAFLATT